MARAGECTLALPPSHLLPHLSLSYAGVAMTVIPGDKLHRESVLVEFFKRYDFLYYITEPTDDPF